MTTDLSNKTDPQRWTAIAVEPHEGGGFVAYGDYLVLASRLEEAQQKIVAQAVVLRDYITLASSPTDNWPELALCVLEAAREVFKDHEATLAAHDAKVAAEAKAEAMEEAREAQQQLELYAAEMSAAREAGFYSAQELWSAYQTAQQLITDQQLVMDEHVFMRAEHDAKVAAEAKAEALEEAKALVLKRGEQIGGAIDPKRTAIELGLKAAEYLAKAKGEKP